MQPLRPLEPDTLREVSTGVFYRATKPDSFFLVDLAAIDFVKARAAASPTGRARICAHPDPSAEQHDMLIASHRDTYVAPHRHPSKSESFLVLDGCADIYLFNDDGSLRELIPMGPFGSGRPFFYRMPAKQFHALTVTSETLVFVESTKGPFDETQTEYATWAPSPDQMNEGRAYLAALRS